MIDNYISKSFIYKYKYFTWIIWTRCGIFDSLVYLFISFFLFYGIILAPFLLGIEKKINNKPLISFCKLLLKSILLLIYWCFGLKIMDAFYKNYFINSFFLHFLLISSRNHIYSASKIYKQYTCFYVLNKIYT